MEATAAALPVIATSVGALAEAVQPGQTGLIVPPRDVQALRAALGRLIEDWLLRQAMGQAAHVVATERFVASTNHQLILQLLAEQARLGARPGRAA
jgi:glycosyltransferase involved in cell wall biosynthesis